MGNPKVQTRVDREGRIANLKHHTGGLERFLMRRRVDQLELRQLDFSCSPKYTLVERLSECSERTNIVLFSEKLVRRKDEE